VLCTNASTLGEASREIAFLPGLQLFLSLSPTLVAMQSCIFIILREICYELVARR